MAIENALDYEGLIYYDGKSKDYIEEKINESSATSTVNGSPVLLQGSADSNLIDFTAYGRCEQKQYSGKNFLNNTATNFSGNGVTRTINDNKSITVNGSPTGNASFVKLTQTIKAGKWIFSGCPKGGSSSTYSQIISIDGDVSYLYDYGNGVEFELATDTDVVLYLARIVNGYTANNLVFNPMIRPSGTDNTYELYVGGTASPNPSYPQSINAVGDSGYFDGEWVQGFYETNGSITSHAERISAKKLIPCKVGDVIKFTYGEIVTKPVILFFNNGVYLSQASGDNVAEIQATVPTNTTHFGITIVKTGGITPSSAKKTVTTINGKYALIIKNINKNIANLNDVKKISVENITIDGNTIIIGANSAIYGFKMSNPNMKVGETYTLSVESMTDHSTTNYGFRYSYVDGTYSGWSNSLVSTITLEKALSSVLFYVGSTYTGNKEIRIEKLQIEVGNTKTDYVAHEEKVTYIPITHPLYGIGDTRDEISFDKIQYSQFDKIQKFVFDGSESGWNVSANRYAYKNITNAKLSKGVMSTHYINGDGKTVVNGTAYINSNSMLIICDDRFSTVDEWKAWLAENPITVYYQVADNRVLGMGVADQTLFYNMPTYNGVTHIDASDDAEMEVEYYKNSNNGNAIIGLDVKVQKINDEIEVLSGEVVDVQTQLNTKAPLASPTLTGTPKAPTATAGTNTTQIATTAFVQTAVSNLVNGAPETMNTLNELAEAIEEHQDVTDALNAAIGNKANASDLTTHTGDTDVHITSGDRTKWNLAYSQGHGHSNQTVLDNTTASYTTAEKTKLSNIAAGAEVNQNAFSNVVVGSTTIAADSKTDTLTLEGSNVTLTTDDTNDKVTIGITKQNVIDALGYTPGTSDATPITVDSELSSTSTNPVQNKVINSALAGKVESSHTHTVSQISDLTATATELNYMDGVTSNVQTQLNEKAASSHGTHVSFSTTNPVVAGTASVGTATTVSRSDHVHPAQTTVSGNAGSATKLATARTIDGVSFNGSANITHFGTCSTAAATAAKTVDLTGFTLATGASVKVKFTVTNTAASPTLNVNSTGAKAIMYRGSAISAGYLAANRVYEFVYDGTDWEFVGDIDTNTNTMNTAGSTNTTSKIFLVGATSQATNPVTYSRSGTYVDADGTLASPKLDICGKMLYADTSGVSIDGDLHVPTIFPYDTNAPIIMDGDVSINGKLETSHLNFVYFTTFTELGTLLNEKVASNTNTSFNTYYPIYVGTTSSSSRVDLGTLSVSAPPGTNYNISQKGVILDFCFCPKLYSTATGNTSLITTYGVSIKNLKLDHKDSSAITSTNKALISLYYPYGSSWTTNIYTVHQECHLELENCNIVYRMWNSSGTSSSDYKYHKMIDINGDAIIRNNMLHVEGIATSAINYNYMITLETSRMYNLTIEGNQITRTATYKHFSVPLNIKSYTSGSTTSDGNKYYKSVLLCNNRYGGESYIGQYTVYVSGQANTGYGKLVNTGNTTV